MLSSLVKDCGDIYSRLFDHRPFTNGEIHFFIKEFEETRKDRERRRLEEIVKFVRGSEESVQHIKESKTLSSQLNKLNTLVDIACDNSNTIIDNQTLFNTESALKERREEREKEWLDFNILIQNNKTQIESEFLLKQKDIIMNYRELDNKLCLIQH